MIRARMATSPSHASASLTGIAQFSLSQLEAATNDFSEDSYVERGYYKGVLLHNGLDVVAAIKKFPVSNDLELQHELNIRAKLEHRNIVKLLGYAKVEKRLCFLVEEYMSNAKSLENIIINASRLDWPSCFKIIQGIAKGLHYLHKKWVLYMDLKPNNILVRSDMDPVIINFGSSVVLDGDDDTISGDTLAGTL
uniref:Protein kinase domain-containing protein n=1 Tax=Aegilops tauschii subsp. strangulata TaxID=200361 RepID=A0A453Q7K9_AEGTS